MSTEDNPTEHLAESSNVEGNEPGDDGLPPTGVDVTATKDSNSATEPTQGETEQEGEQQIHQDEQNDARGTQSPSGDQESKGIGEGTTAGQTDASVDESTPLVAESQPGTAADETTPLVGAEAAETQDSDDDDEATPEGDAPPLPDKPPLPTSREDLTVSICREDSDHEETSSESSHDSEQQATDATPAVTVQPTTAATEQNAPASLPFPGDVLVGVAASPNEPPPPYPGGPQSVTSGDPYDGTPGDDRIVTDDRVVIVQRGGIVGNCPKCHTGNVMKSFSFCGICLAIWLFPCGLLCLFCMREKKCSHCNEKI